MTLFDILKKLMGVQEPEPTPAPAEPPKPDTPAEKTETPPGWEGEPPYRYVDVSRWNGVIDWAQVKAAGYRGAMLRAMGNSKDGKPSKPYLDPTFERNYAECTRLGIPVGVYGYFKAVNKAEADRELAMLKSSLTGKVLSLPVAVDVEDKLLAALDKQTLTDLTAYELAAVEQMGFYAQLYTYTAFANSRLYMGGAALKPYDVWLADYTGKTPKVSFAYGAHQHTSNGSVLGINGNVDLNVTTVNYPKIIEKKGLTRLREGA